MAIAILSLFLSIYLSNYQIRLSLERWELEKPNFKFAQDWCSDLRVNETGQLLKSEMPIIINQGLLPGTFKYTIYSDSEIHFYGELDNNSNYITTSNSNEQINLEYLLPSQTGLKISLSFKPKIINDSFFYSETFYSKEGLLKSLDCNCTLEKTKKIFICKGIN
ncbi:MAG: hypothetical protein PHP82_02805 [Candidatus ainarchaeum sp.]|nr:hypothetical protein [Candidatus ainarchaeum sp.]